MTRSKKIAIIGTGISGLSAAYLLNKKHNISIYEKNNYVGGHSRTIEIPDNNNHIAVDTGFIVFNHHNYPNLTSLFSLLGVETVKSHMSFGISTDDGEIEYGTSNIGGIFAQKRNILRPKFISMLADIVKFNRNALKILSKHNNITLGDFLKKINLGDWFVNYYLLPMGASIWSCSAEQMLDFPASSFLKFFDNHGLLTISDQPQWYTVKGGSKKYVERLINDFKSLIQLNNAAKQVIREKDSILVVDEKGAKKHYDEVIFACHSDQSIKLIDKPTKLEREILGSINYKSNRIYVHSDNSFMPKRRAAWSSWVYLSQSAMGEQKDVSLTYWMNNLQPLKTKKEVFVTLNPTRKPSPDLTYDEHVFEHPIFDFSAVNSQQKIDSIQGVDRLWFCGAYQKYGFHEDGIASAVNLVKKMGCEIPWS